MLCRPNSYKEKDEIYPKKKQICKHTFCLSNGEKVQNNNNKKTSELQEQIKLIPIIDTHKTIAIKC